ncbi:hypothetical protein [Rhizobium rhizogenes]|uniref:hypothetical protein n=1 Tax=Rhizobium rhizogenes TaxID=359 RepID=UPI001572DCEC|nr:hypothetical protein [Rhizobium rhizogenes]
MAQRTDEHITGDRGELKNRDVFEELGYATSKVEKDYGEDFFVATHADGGTIEPSRIFVQSKATDPDVGDSVRWTEYLDPLTVRNWILGNEMVVVIKRDLRSKIAKYCIPEEVYNYSDVHKYLFGAEVPRKFPIVCDLPLTEKTPEQLVWRARVRHYDRLIRLVALDEQFEGLPAEQVYALELAHRLGLLSAPLLLSEAAIQALQNLPNLGEFPASGDMSADDHRRFAACVCVTIARIDEVAPGFGVSQTTLDLVSTELARAYREWQGAQRR